MRNHFATAAIVVLALMTAPRLQAQAPTPQSPAVPQWQTDAGGKMAFDVASVKENKSDTAMRTNFPLDNGDSYSPNGGLFSVAKFPLATYIAFAYKLKPYEIQFLLPQLPKWVTTDRFDIEARAQGNPTKDQMRLMMQSLLVDRFKLVLHWETRQLPVFGLVLVKPGKTGPQLTPHTDDPPCAALPPPGSAPPPSTKRGFPAVCGLLTGQVVSGHMEFRGRSISMGYLADWLVPLGNLDRPIFDQTKLSGTFDLTMDLPDFPPPGATTQPDSSAPTFLEVLQDELGLKLDRQTGAVDVLVIDHVEEPTPN